MEGRWGEYKARTCGVSQEPARPSRRRCSWGSGASCGREPAHLPAPTTVSLPRRAGFSLEEIPLERANDHAASLTGDDDDDFPHEGRHGAGDWVGAATATRGRLRRMLLLVCCHGEAIASVYTAGIAETSVPMR